MKAQMDTTQSGSRIVPKNGENKVLKAKAKERDVSQEEMQSLLAKLKELVPNMPRNKKLSKLEIIQNVIDYIFDLQNALETQPPRSTAAASLVGGGSTSSRQPLGVLSPSANAVVNICGVQEASHPDKSPGHLGDLAITSPRPVSC